MKRSNPVSADCSTARKSPLRAWLGLAFGLGLLWAATYIVLPWGQTLPYIKPIMQAIEESNIDAGAYWYTQSEETALAQMYVRHAIRRVK
jgi:hypothetical protein